MSTVTCPGCRRRIELPAGEMSLPSITCSACETMFRPTDHAFSVETWPPPRRPRDAGEVLAERLPLLILLAVLLTALGFLFIRILQDRPLF